MLINVGENLSEKTLLFNFNEVTYDMFNDEVTKIIEVDENNYIYTEKGYATGIGNVAYIMICSSGNFANGNYEILLSISEDDEITSIEHILTLPLEFGEVTAINTNSSFYNLIEVDNSTKIYGVKENKELAEVYSRGSLAVLEGIINTPAGGWGSSVIDFPEGFNKENCVVISLGTKPVRNYLTGYTYETNVHSDNDEVIGKFVTLGSYAYPSKIHIHIVNPFEETEMNSRYRLVLMKI